MRTLWLVLLLGLAGPAWATAPSYTPPDSVDARNPLYLFDKNGVRMDSLDALSRPYRFRGYIAKADSSQPYNQIDLTWARQDSAWVARAARDCWVHIYRISPGTNSLIMRWCHLAGKRPSPGTTDSTALAVGAINDTTKFGPAIVVMTKDASGRIRLKGSVDMIAGGDTTWTKYIAMHDSTSGVTVFDNNRHPGIVKVGHLGLLGPGWSYYLNARETNIPGFVMSPNADPFNVAPGKCVYATQDSVAFFKADGATEAFVILPDSIRFYIPASFVRTGHK